MIGVIPAAGKGSRLGFPCKPLVSVAGKPIIFHVLDCMLQVGVERVVIVVKGDVIEKTVGVEYKGLSVEYVQQRRLLGIAHAVLQARKVVDRDCDLFVMLGDIVYTGCDLKIFRKRFEASGKIAFFGVVPVNGKGMKSVMKSYGIRRDTHRIVEKPKDYKNFFPLIGAGLYFFKSKPFFSVVDGWRPGRTGEVEITSVLDFFGTNNDVGWELLGGFYSNVNTVKDLGLARTEVRIDG